MGARLDRRFFLGATALVGAVLLGVALVLQTSESRHRAAPAPEPAWRTADRSAAYFAKQLRPLDTADSASVARILAALRNCKFFECTDVPIRMRMTRSLNSGHVFESDVILTCRAVAAGHDVELNATRWRQEPLRLRVAVRAGAITAIETGTGEPPLWQPWTGAQDLPLALGDLQVGEVLRLGQACVEGALKPLGYVAGMGTRPQLVLESSLISARHTPSGDVVHENLPAAGERALAYVDSATCELRSVRVLDAQGYLVRVYDGFDWTPAESGTRLFALQATSIPSSSHTVFR